jgi:hypothetical protein
VKQREIRATAVKNKFKQSTGTRPKNPSASSAACHVNMHEQIPVELRTESTRVPVAEAESQKTVSNPKDEPAGSRVPPTWIEGLVNADLTRHNEAVQVKSIH